MKNFTTTDKNEPLDRLMEILKARAAKAGVALNEPYVADAEVDCDGHGRREERAIYADADLDLYVFPTDYRDAPSWVAQEGPALTDADMTFGMPLRGHDSPEGAIDALLLAVVAVRLRRR